MLRTGHVNLAKLPRATAKDRQHLTPAQAKSFNRPLKSAAQLASYRKQVFSHPSRLPTSATAVAAPTPATLSRNFIASNARIPQLRLTGDGINYTQSGCNCTPPDQAIGVSAANIIYEGVNNLLKVYNGSLGKIYGPVTAQSFFAPLYHTGDFFSDPQITYDSTRGRWLVTWLEINSAGTADYIDVAVSTSSSNYSTHFYEYQIPASASGSGDFCDYPTLGYDYWAEWVSCVTFNGPSGNFLGNRVFGFPLDQMGKGAALNYMWFYNIPTDLNAAAYRLSPAIEDGTPQGQYVTATDAGYTGTHTNLTTCAFTNTIAIQHGSLATGTCITNTMPLSYTDPVGAPQPGTTSTLYPGYGTKQIMYLDGKLWFAIPVTLNCSGTVEDGIWWGDVTPQLTAVSAGYPQSVTHVVSGYTENAYWCYSGSLYSFMPSIMPSGETDAALSFNVSAATTYYPGIVYTGRMSVDPPNTMGSTGASAFAVSGSSANTTGRFGDYSACALAMNYVVRNIIWCAGEYGGSDVWNTRLFELRMQ